MRFPPFHDIYWLYRMCVAYCLAYTKFFRGEKPVVINSIGWSLAYISILPSVNYWKICIFQTWITFEIFMTLQLARFRWRYFFLTLFSLELNQLWEENREYHRCDRMLELYIPSKGQNLCVNHQHEDDSGLCKFYVWSRKVTFHDS